MNIFKIESYQKGIAISSFFNIISKLILFLNSIVVAYYFGTQTKTDIYFYVMSSIIGLMVTLISGLNMTVFIPESMRIREQESEKKSMNFLNFFLYIYIALGIIITIPLLINYIGVFTFLSKFGEKVLQENHLLLILFIPLFSLILIVNYLTDILTSYKYFTMPMFASIINNSFALLFIIFFHATLDIHGILIGLNIAFIINIILLLTLMRRKLHWKFNFKRIEISHHVRKTIIYSQAGNIASILGSFVPAYILSSFGSGIITALNIGQRLANIPSDFITSQFISISGIRYNELYAKKDFNRLNHVFSETAKFLIFILVPISALMFLFANDIVKILFYRGKFDMISVNNSALFMKYLVLILPFYAINNLAAKLYMAAQIMNYAFWYQIIANLMLIGLVYIGLENFGAIGFPYALLTQYVLNIIVVYFYVKYLLPFIKYYKILIYLCLILLLNVILGFIVHHIIKYIDNNNVRLITGVSIYLISYLIMNIVFRINYQTNFYFNLALNKIFPKIFKNTNQEKQF